MASNLGATTLKRSRPSRHPMHDYDALPDPLRRWVSTAVLPWRSKSVKGAYEKALAKTGDARSALEALEELQRKLVARDACKIWGADHPDATLR